MTKASNELGKAFQDKLYVKQFPIEVFTGTYTFDYRFDIYQIGLTMYRMCVGDDEFNRQFETLVDSFETFFKVLEKKEFPLRKAYPKHIPKKLQQIINKCLNPKIEQRYQSCIEIVNAMADIDGSILDWKYSKDNEIEIWQENLENNPKVVKLCTNGTCVAFIQYSDGKTRNISALCKENVSEEELIAFLEKGK